MGGQVGRQMTSFIEFVKEERGKPSLIQGTEGGSGGYRRERRKQQKGSRFDGIGKHHECPDSKSYGSSDIIVLSLEQG